MSHGPLIHRLVMVSRTLPAASNTSRQPAFAVAAVPSRVGRLPTITHPDLRTARAVVNPTPPGQRPGSRAASTRANRVAFPWAVIWTRVLPVPCRLPAALKLLTSTEPPCSLPTVRGTTATPYGLRSPLAGTVEEIVLSVLTDPRKVGAAAAAVIPIPTIIVAAAPTAVSIRVIRAMTTSRDQGRQAPDVPPASWEHDLRASKVQPPQQTTIVGRGSPTRPGGRRHRTPAGLTGRRPSAGSRTRSIG